MGSLRLTTGGSRQYQVKYRKPFGTKWEDLNLGHGLDVIAGRVRRDAPPRRVRVSGAPEEHTLSCGVLGPLAARPARGPGSAAIAVNKPPRPARN